MAGKDEGNFPRPVDANNRGNGTSGSFLTTSLNFPTLKKSDAESIPLFLRRYDQYVAEVPARHARRVSTEDDDECAEPALPVTLKFCMDMQWVLSAIALGLIKHKNRNPSNFGQTCRTELAYGYERQECNSFLKMRIP